MTAQKQGDPEITQKMKKIGVKALRARINDWERWGGADDEIVVSIYRAMRSVSASARQVERVETVKRMLETPPKPRSPKAPKLKKAVPSK